MSSLITKLRESIPESKLSWILTAIRQDKIIWERLQDASFSKKVLEHAAGDHSLWSPGSIAVLAIKRSVSISELQNPKFKPIPPKLRTQAAKVFEDFTYSPNQKRNPDISLEEAGFLAIALRERRRMVGSWENLDSELKFASPEFWKTPIACLYGILPDADELLFALLELGKDYQYLELVQHAIISTPNPPEKITGIYYNLIQSSPEQISLKLLRPLSQQRPEIADVIAQQLLADMDVQDNYPKNNLSQFQFLLWKAELLLISGQQLKAHSAHIAAWKIVDRIKTDHGAKLSISAARNNQLDLAITSLEDLSGNYSDDIETAYNLSLAKIEAGVINVDNDANTTNFEKDDKNPLTHLANSYAALNADNIKNAKSSAQKALHYGLIESTKKGNNVIELLPKLLEQLIVLEMYPEAQQAARLSLELTPNNVDLLNTLSSTLTHTNESSQAIELAHMAVGLQPDNAQLRRQLAKMLIDASQWDSATKELEAIISSQDTPLDDDLIMQAKCLLQLNQSKQAIDICMQLLDNNPDAGEVHAVLGESYLIQKDHELAKKHLEKATRLAPQLPLPWVKLAAMLDGQGRDSDAITTLESGVRAIPDDPQIHFLLGQSYQRSGNKSKALEEYEISSKLIPSQYNSPNNLLVEVSIQLAKSQQDLDENDKALHTLKQAYKAYPAHPEIASVYGEMLLTSGEYQTALAPLDAARKSMPENPEPHVNFASALIALNQNLDEARSALKAAIDVDPKNAMAIALSAEAAYLGDTPEDAIALYKDALDTKLANEPAWQKRLNLGLAKTALKVGQPDLAIKALKRTQKVSGPESSILKLLSEAHYQSNQFEKSLEAARQAYGLSPDDEEVIAWFGDQAFKLNAIEDAVIALEQAFANDPHKTDLLVRIGHLQWQNSDPDKAKGTFDKLFRSKHATSENLQMAANELVAIGDTHKAIKFLDRALEFSSASPSYKLLHELTTAYHQIGETETALKILERNIALTPNDPELLGAKARMLMELGRPKAAMDSIEKSLKLNPNDSQLHFDAATILQKSGEFDIAEEHAESALRLEPENLTYQFLTAEIYHSNLKPKHALDLLNIKRWTSKEFEIIATDQDDGEKLSLLKFHTALSLAAGDITTASKLLDFTAKEKDTELYALHTWLAALSGDTVKAKKSFDKAKSRVKESFENLPSPAKLSAVRSSMANAALAVQEWQTAIRYFREAASNSPSETLAQFNIAKALVLRAEFQRACQAVEAIQHAPGIKSLNSKTQDEFESAIDTALRHANDPEAVKLIHHWQARGRDAFAQDDLDNERPSTYPETPEESASLIAATHRTGDVDKGREIAANESNHPAILTQLALLLAKDHPREAVKKAQMAADLAPGPINNALLAILSQHTGNKNLAIKGIEQALADWPDEPRWHLLAGKTYSMIGQTNSAIAHLQKGAQIEPDHHLHHLYLGRSYLDIELPEKAIQSLNIAVDLDKNDPKGWLGLASAHLMTGDIPNAGKYAKRAAKLAPQQAAPAALKAKIGLAGKQPEKAQKHLQRGLKSHPNDPELLSLLAETYVALNRPEDALKAIERATKKSENPTALLLQRVKLIESTRGSQAALKTMKEITKRYPDEPRILTELSNRLFEAGKTKDAIRVSQHAVKANTDKIEPFELSQLHFQLGTQLHQTGQLDQALHHLSEAIDLAPHFLDAYLEIGQVHQKRRQPQEALEYFQRATGIAPHDPRPFVETGLALKESKDFANAESMLRTASALAPKDPTIQRSLAAIVALNLVHPTPPRNAAASQ